MAFRLLTPFKVTSPPGLTEAIKTRRIVAPSMISNAVRFADGAVKLDIDTFEKAQAWFHSAACWSKLHRKDVTPLPGVTHETVGAARARAFATKERALDVLREVVERCPLTDDQRRFVVERTIGRVPEVEEGELPGEALLFVSPFAWQVLSGDVVGGTDRVRRAGGYHRYELIQDGMRLALQEFRERVEMRGKRRVFVIRGPDDDRLLREFKDLMLGILRSYSSQVDEHAARYPHLAYRATARRAARAQHDGIGKAVDVYWKHRRARSGEHVSCLRVPPVLRLDEVPWAFFKERGLPAALDAWGWQEREWRGRFGFVDGRSVDLGPSAATDAFRKKHPRTDDREGFQRKPYERAGACELETGGQPFILEPSEIDWKKDVPPDVVFWRWWPGVDTEPATPRPAALEHDYGWLIR